MTEITTEIRSILVADDDDDIRSIIVSALEGLGIKIIQASDGQEAIEKCVENLPDIAVLDYTVPRATGLEVCKFIKEQQNGQLVPVVMLTARDGLKDKVDALTDGVDEYLTKPFNYQELKVRVKALMRIRSLNLDLQQKNIELQAMQKKIVEHERQLVATELAGATAHKLGQPLSAILLNSHLLETVEPTNVTFGKALVAIKSDIKRMAEIIEKMKTIDAKNKSDYHDKNQILDL